MVSSSSDRPDPTRPKRPTISPRATSSEMLRKCGARDRLRIDTPEWSAFAAGAMVTCAPPAPADRAGRSRPTIARTMSAVVTACACEGANQFAVAQHGDAIAQPEYFRQAMRHVQQRRAAALQLAQDVEQVIRFRIRERGGRLVEHQDLAVERQARGQLAAAADARPTATPAGVSGSMPSDEPIEQHRRARAHRGLIEPAVAAHLAAGEDVARHAQVRKAQHLLVDHADAVLDGLRVGWRD